MEGLFRADLEGLYRAGVAIIFGLGRRRSGLSIVTRVDAKSVAAANDERKSPPGRLYIYKRETSYR